VEGRRAQQDRPLQVHKCRDTERQGAQARGTGTEQVGSEIQAEAGLGSRALAENESPGRQKERERGRGGESARYLAARLANKPIRICMASNAKQRETCFYTFLYSMSPARFSLSSSLSLLVLPPPLVPSHSPSRVPLPSRQLSSLCLVRLAGSSDHDESFLLDSHPPSYPSPLLALPPRIFILACYASYVLPLFTLLHSFSSQLRYSICARKRDHRRIQILSIKLIKVGSRIRYLRD